MVSMYAEYVDEEQRPQSNEGGLNKTKGYVAMRVGCFLYPCRIPTP